MADAKHSPAQVLSEFRGALVPGCDLDVVDEFLKRYLESGDTARAEAARLERLHDAAPALLEALVWREQFEPREGEGANERFERIAEAFHRETGHLRPGKDCRVEPIEVRQQAWDDWMEAGRVRVRAAIAKATGGAA